MNSAIIALIIQLVPQLLALVEEGIAAAQANPAPTPLQWAQYDADLQAAFDRLDKVRAALTAAAAGAGTAAVS